MGPIQKVVQVPAPGCHQEVFRRQDRDLLRLAWLLHRDAGVPQVILSSDWPISIILSCDWLISIPSLAGLAVFVYGLVMMGEDQPTEADLSAVFDELF